MKKFLILCHVRRVMLPYMSVPGCRHFVSRCLEVVVDPQLRLFESNSIREVMFKRVNELIWQES